MSYRAILSVLTAHSSTPNPLTTADIHPLVEPHLNGAVRQRAIEARLEVEVQAFERHRLQEKRPCSCGVLEEAARTTAAQGPCPEGGTECFRLTKKQSTKHTIKPDGRSAGPADFQETADQYREAEGDDPLYPRTVTPVDPGLGRHQPHLLGPQLLQQSSASS
jgi:hypothetical protein